MFGQTPPSGSIFLLFVSYSLQQVKINVLSSASIALQYQLSNVILNVKYSVYL